MTGVCLNHDPGITLTFSTARSTSKVAHPIEWGKLLQCHLKGKTCSKLANGLNLYDLKKKVTPEIALTLPWGYIHVYYHSIGIYLRSQLSIYRTIGPLVLLL